MVLSQLCKPPRNEESCSATLTVCELAHSRWSAQNATIGREVTGSSAGRSKINAITSLGPLGDDRTVSHLISAADAEDISVTSNGWTTSG